MRKPCSGCGRLARTATTSAFGIGADRRRPAAEAVGRPFGVAAMRARHVVGIGAMPAAAIAALMGGDALAAMEHLDGAGRQTRTSTSSRISPCGTE